MTAIGRLLPGSFSARYVPVGNWARLSWPWRRSDNTWWLAAVRTHQCVAPQLQYPITDICCRMDAAKLLKSSGGDVISPLSQYRNGRMPEKVRLYINTLDVG